MTGLTTAFLALCAITLNGLTGENLKVRAHFDANNVRVGDPMTLSIDFTGNADYSDIHPPKIGNIVDRKIWRIYDSGAKTQTFRDGRRLTYRVRPLKEGIWRFPALEFAYQREGVGETVVSSLPIPVHVKPGTQAALAGLESEGEDGFQMPDGIVIGLKETVDDDSLFKWRKACRNPKAEEFAKFPYTEARLNEAACLTLAGNWSGALKIYSRLEWLTGQTPTIERGIIAALSRKNDGVAELPVWRSVLRPVLRYDWRGRVAIILAALAGFSLVMWASGRIIRSLASIVIVLLLLLPTRVGAQDMFEAIERMHREMDEHMQKMLNQGMGTSITINNMRQEPVDIKAYVSLDKADVQVGDAFRYIVSVEAPKSYQLGQMRFTPSEAFGMTVLGNIETMIDGKSVNTNNVVKRFAIPVRYDVPFKGHVSFRIEGMISSTRQVGGRGRMSSFSFSQNFSVDSSKVYLAVKPLPGENQPKDFLGAVGTDFKLAMHVDSLKVETNDVIRVFTELSFRGYVPPLEGETERNEMSVVRERYFVADGAMKINDETFTYYDAGEKKYNVLTVRGPKLEYHTPDEGGAETVAVNSNENGAIVLRFAPSEAAAVVATVHGGMQVESCGEWVRLDDGSHAGWARKEDVK